jgi:hypothetical protein
MTRHLLKIAIAGAVLVPAFATAPAHAQATRTWVSGVGDDANPCSRTAPCKTFAGAISKTAGGGEINCLDPGGFGTVTITKSIKIDCLQFPGGILSAGVTGVNVSSTAGVKVILRGIEIEGAGTGVHGVSVNVPSEVSLEKMHISGITGNGVNVNPTTAGTTNLIVMDTVITQAAKGIAVAAAVGGSSLAAVRNTNIFKVSSTGVSLDTNNAFATISNSMLTGNATGAAAAASGSQLNVAKSMISYNSTVGLSGVAGSTVRMTDNTIVNNTASTSVAGTFQSGGDNKLDIAGTAPGGMVNQ